jgi:hypothetical protein
MGEAKRRQKADPDWGKSPAPRVKKLEQDDAWVLEQMLEIAELERYRKQQLRRIAKNGVDRS